MITATDYFYDIFYSLQNQCLYLFLKAAAQFAAMLITISGSVNWCWCVFKCTGQSMGMAIVSALICVMVFVLVLMDNEGLSPLPFLFPILSFHHWAALVITTMQPLQNSTRVRLD